MKTSIIFGPKMVSVDNFQSELRELHRLSDKFRLSRVTNHSSSLRTNECKLDRYPSPNLPSPKKAINGYSSILTLYVECTNNTPPHSAYCFFI